MIRYTSAKQLSLEGFKTDFVNGLDPNNRWIKLAEIIPWDAFAEAYYQNMSSNTGRPGKDARVVIGAVIIKHKLCLSDEETVYQIQENPYLQYFVGFQAFQHRAPFVPSLLVEIRKRMGHSVFAAFETQLIEQLGELKTRRARSATKKDDDSEPPSSADQSLTSEKDDTIVTEPEVSETMSEQESPPQGTLIVDATVAEQAIRYPTDISLLNEAREKCEAIIDALCAVLPGQPKPRDYRRNARRDYLAFVKRRKPGKKARQRALKQQRQYVRRDIELIHGLFDRLPGREIPLPYPMLRQFYILQTLYAQQCEMHQEKKNRCDDRIVSIHQPHVRPIVRGKLNKAVEFGAKISVSLTADKIACLDALRWDAYHEAQDLQLHVENYREKHGHYPKKVIADPAYGTQANRAYLKAKNMDFAGKALGRPKKINNENKKELAQAKRQRREDYRRRIPIEGKFGQGKNGYGLSYIRARTPKTSYAWIASIFLVMNLLILAQAFSFALIKSVIQRTLSRLQGGTSGETHNHRPPTMGGALGRNFGFCF